MAYNRRYFDAMALVDVPTPAGDELRQFTELKVVEGRSYAGFNPARGEDLQLFQALLDGDHIARGFRNEDIREPLIGCPKFPLLQRRTSAAMGRLLKRMHVRKFVPKILGTQRWRLAERGGRLLALAFQLHQATWPRLAARPRVTTPRSSPQNAKKII
jgi:hypothetical protein